MATTTAQSTALTFRSRPSVRGLIEFLMEADARHRARAQFGLLDDRLLRDIGLTRADRDAALTRGDLL